MAENQIKSLSDSDLVQQVRARERELVGARFAHNQSQLENTATLRQIRKDLARMQTEIRARELAQGLPKGSLVAANRPARPAEGEAAPVAEQQAPAERGGFLKGIVDRLTGKE